MMTNKKINLKNSYFKAALFLPLMGLILACGTASESDKNLVPEGSIEAAVNPLVIEGESSNPSFKIRGGAESPLIVVDGVVLESTETSIESMDPNKIESLNVLKGEKASEKYGDKGANGVIEIKTK